MPCLAAFAVLPAGHSTLAVTPRGRSAALPAPGGAPEGRGLPAAPFGRSWLCRFYLLAVPGWPFSRFYLIAARI